MKVNYKKILTIFLLTAFLAPTLVVAVESRGYCSRISDLSSRIEQRINKQNERLREKQDKISIRIEEGRQRRGIKLEKRHERWDENREEHFAKMEEKAGTDEQKQAVSKFVKTIQAAISVRRKAVAMAIQGFRNGVSGIKASHKSFANSAISDYEDEIGLAFEKAQSDCDNDVKNGIIQKNLRAELKQAKENFASSKKEANRDKMEALVEIKKEAIKKATDDFKAIMEQAIEELKS